MPATRAATKRAEAKHAALHIAALNAQTQPLNPELVEVVIRRLPRSALPSVRLASRQFATAADPLITAITIITNKQDSHVTQAVGLQHVVRLDLRCERTTASPQWRQLQAITCQLPKLNTLQHMGTFDPIPATFTRSLSSLTNLTRLDLGQRKEPPGIAGGGLIHVPQGPQLPGLRAAFLSASYSLDMDELVAFAPNLEQLHCCFLDIYTASGALPNCTHFGGTTVFIHTKSPATSAAAQAFAAAFPNLQVVTDAPGILHSPEGQPPELPTIQQLLALLPSVWALRHWSCLALHLGTDPQAMPQLKRLWLQGSDRLVIQSIYSKTQLQHVCIARVEAELAGELVRGLAALPQLQCLALPAALLCSRCCPGVQSSLQALTASGSLKQLVFLEWHDQVDGVLGQGRNCTHVEAMSTGLQTVRAAAASFWQQHQHQPGAQQQQVQQQQLEILRHQQHVPTFVSAETDNPDSEASVWGVYAPPKEWL